MTRGSWKATPVAIGIAGAALVSMLAAGAVYADQTEAKCGAGKNKAAGDYADCVQSAAAKLLTTKGTCSLATTTVCYGDGDCPNPQTCTKDSTKYDAALAKCEEKLATGYDKQEQKAADAGGACPTTSDAVPIQGLVDECAGSIQDATAPGGAVPSCGDDFLNVAGEQCDGADLGGATCASLGFSGGTLSCSACGLDTSGCTTVAGVLKTG